MNDVHHNDNRPFPAAPARLVTREEAAGAAVAVLSGGADAAYLFNYFQHGHPGWPVPEYQRTLRAFSSMDELQKLPRRHAVTYRDVTLPDEVYRAPLPASGMQLSFALPLGPVPAAGWKLETSVEIAAAGSGDALPGVFVNGVAGAFCRSETVKSGGRLVTHEYPVIALSGKGRDVIVVKAGGAVPVKVQRVEVSVRA